MRSTKHQRKVIFFLYKYRMKGDKMGKISFEEKQIGRVSRVVRIRRMAPLFDLWPGGAHRE